MTETTWDDDRALAELLADGEWHFGDAAQGPAPAPEPARAVRAGKVRTVVETVRELKAAFQLVQEERGRVGKLVKHSTGVVPDHVLDLHAARDEIGRRLACLRGAGGH